jgi:hypothetical protein
MKRCSESVWRNPRSRYNMKIDESSREITHDRGFGGYAKTQMTEKMDVAILRIMFYSELSTRSPQSQESFGRKGRTHSQVWKP